MTADRHQPLEGIQVKMAQRAAEGAQTLVKLVGQWFAIPGKSRADGRSADHEPRTGRC